MAVRVLLLGARLAAVRRVRGDEPGVAVVVIYVRRWIAWEQLHSFLADGWELAAWTGGVYGVMVCKLNGSMEARTDAD